MKDWDVTFWVISVVFGIVWLWQRRASAGDVVVTDEERDSGLAALASSYGWHVASETDPGTLPAWFSDAPSRSRWSVDGTVDRVQWVAWCSWTSKPGGDDLNLRFRGAHHPISSPRSWMTAFKADLGRQSRVAVRLASPPASKLLTDMLSSDTMRRELAEQFKTKVVPGGLSAEDCVSLMTMDPAKAVTPPEALVTRKFTAAAVRDSAAFLTAVAPSVVEYFDRAQETSAGKYYLSVMVMENEVVVSVEGIIDRPADIGRFIAVGIAAMTAVLG